MLSIDQALQAKFNQKYAGKSNYYPLEPEIYGFYLDGSTQKFDKAEKAAESRPEYILVVTNGFEQRAEFKNHKSGLYILNRNLEETSVDIGFWKAKFINHKLGQFYKEEESLYRVSDKNGEIREKHFYGSGLNGFICLHQFLKSNIRIREWATLELLQDKKYLTHQLFKSDLNNIKILEENHKWEELLQKAPPTIKDWEDRISKDEFEFRRLNKELKAIHIDILVYKVFEGLLTKKNYQYVKKVSIDLIWNINQLGMGMLTGTKNKTMLAIYQRFKSLTSNSDIILDEETKNLFKILLKD